MTASPTTKPPVHSSATGSRERFSSRSVRSAIAVLLLALVLFAHEATGIDFKIQDRLYQPDAKQWLVTKESELPRILFYHAPKVVLIALGSWWLLSAVLAGPHTATVTHSWRSKRPRRELIYLLICLAGFPASIGGLKKASGVYCPSELTRYGGDHEFRRLIDKRPSGERLGHCFPAGHASGGFALMGLLHVARTRRQRNLAAAMSLGTGFSMGTYQMMVGAHFLTHTLTTWLLACVFTSATYCAVFNRSRANCLKISASLPNS